MNIIRSIFDFVKTLPVWQQDAARRIFGKPDGLDESDFREIYMLMLKENTLGESTLAAIPMADTALPSDKGNDVLVLRSLGELQHINRIDPTQRLEFVDGGMTIVYGKNGSGKSGFARVFKQACFCRDSGEKILPNVADVNETDTTPSATFEFEINGRKQAVKWRQGASENPKALSDVSVFDAKSARIVLSSEQEMRYVPYGLGILETLGSIVLPKMREMLEDEKGRIDVSVKEFNELQGSHAVGGLFANLENADIKEVRKLAVFTDEDISRGKSLRAILNSTNLGESIKTAGVTIARINSIVVRIEKANAVLSDMNFTRWQKMQTDSSDAKQAALIAAQRLQGEDTLIAGTGGEAWKIMFTAAQQFLEEAVGHKGETANYPQCPLCQQPLSSDAKARMLRFDQYIADKVSTLVVATSRAIDEEIKAMSAIDVTEYISDVERNELVEYDNSIASTYNRWVDSFCKRRNDICSALQGSKDWGEVSTIDDSIVERLKAIVRTVQANSDAMTKIMQDANRDAVQKEIDELTARYKLHTKLSDVEAWFERLNRRNRLSELMRSLTPLKITQKIKELSESSISKPLCDSVAAELDALGIRLPLLHPELVARGRRGKMVCSMELRVPNKHPINLVLSEGEQKAVAIASFLGELKMAGHSNAIVFDDPMTSLDHVIRRRVAKRLVAEARKRQVIIFSHEPVFVTKLIGECQQAKVKSKVLSLSCEKNLCGFVTEGMMWEHKGYKERITELENDQRRLSRTIGEYLTPQDEQTIRKVYARLRATIEVVVQDVCLCGTIKRFEDDMHVKRMKDISPIDAEAADSLYNLFGKCSDFLEGHDHASAANENVPLPDELGADIRLLNECIERISLTRKASKGSCAVSKK